VTVRLRAHHLLCTLTYIGEGYSAEFISNYDIVAARLAAGEEIVVVDGPDDICKPLLATANRHCTQARAAQRDRRAAAELHSVLGDYPQPGDHLNISESIERLRSAFASGAIRGACTGCRWSDLCSTVAAQDFCHARIGAGGIAAPIHRSN
jgi:uncharacterized protein